MASNPPDYGASIITTDFVSKTWSTVDYAPLPPLKGGGGDGTSGGMEDRVARLERTYDAMAKDVVDIRVDLATLKANVQHLPSKGFVVTSATTSIGFLTAVIIFGDKIKALVGL